MTENNDLILDKATYEKYRKLEDIFMPLSSRAREEKIRSDNPEGTSADCERMRYSHYTTAEAALKIIKAKNIWMRNAKSMADYSEIEHGYEALLNYFDNNNDKNKDAFLAHANNVFPSSGEKILDTFNKWWNRIQFNTYIASLSAHDKKEDNWGRLSMWRAFGGGGPSVALIIEVPARSSSVTKIGLSSFSPVSYPSKDKICDQIDLAIANVENRKSELMGYVNETEFVASWFAVLVNAVTCTKHEAFSEENEWRAVYIEKFVPMSLIEPTVEIIHGVLQKVFHIPLDAKRCPEIPDLDISKLLSRVIIGPTEYPWVMYEAFVAALVDAGVPEADALTKVIVSGIPLRG